MKKNRFFRLFFILFMLPLIAIAQEVTGTVIDGTTNDPLPGATVLVKGTSKGTDTDFDGNFKLKVDGFPVTLVFSSLGFETIEKTVQKPGAIRVVLKESATKLDEIVITGLASSVKRQNLANAVGTVSAKELVGNTGQPTVDGALYGKLTGVNIVSSSGAPGGGVAIRLRGVSSVSGNNQPLIIVDGVYMNNVEIPSGLRLASGANRENEENSANRFSDIDPNSIENIEVLKGAAAAAIYGNRANAGVIIITTKRGKAGETKFSFGQDFGISQIAKRIGMRNWTAANVEAAFNADEVVLFNQAMANGGLIDYEDEIYGNTGFISENKLSMSGGSEKTKFYAGASYRDEEGIIKNTGFKRLSVKMNLDHKLTDNIDVAVSTNYIRSESSRSFTGNENEGGLSYGYNLAFTRPWINLFPDDEGNYPNNPNASGNVLFVRDQTKNEDLNNRLIQGLKVDANLYNGTNDNVKFVANFGLDYLANRTDVYVPETHQAQVSSGQNGFIAVGKNGFTNFNSQLIGIWNHNNSDNTLNTTFQTGVTYLDQVSNLVLSTASDLIIGQTSLGQGNNQTITQNRSSVREFGYFTQVEGNYKDQVIATLGYRLDKSTLNGDPNKLYGFPRASVAVNLSNFDFWNIDFVNQLKLRTAYGETGTSANFGTIFTSLDFTSIGSNGGLTLEGPKGDPSIRPETSSELEIGLDARFFDKVSLEFSYYNRNVEDLILSRNLPTSSGFSTETRNFADLENKGVELALNIDAFSSEDFVWNTSVRYWHNRSKITRLDIPAFAQAGAGFGLGLGTYYIEEGKPITQLAGSIDGVPTQLGDAEPDFQMSFMNQFTILKNIDFSFLLHWKQGGENVNLSTFLSDLGNTTPDLDSPEGQQRVATSGAARFIESAGYLRLREAAIYYRLPNEVCRSLGVDNIKLGVSGRNLFTITDYKGYDPEVSTNGSSGLSSGIDVTPFPASRQYYFHLNVNF